MPDSIAALHLYRIAQEAVSNAVRHGRASEVGILMQVENGQLSLRIRDNGSGLAQAPDQSPGLGLRTMRYRAEIIGAALGITPGENGGTEVTCTLPYS
jgi:signal transduction histidine kinase